MLRKSPSANADSPTGQVPPFHTWQEQPMDTFTKDDPETAWLTPQQIHALKIARAQLDQAIAELSVATYGYEQIVMRELEWS